MVDDRTTVTLIGYALGLATLITLLLSTTWKRNIAAWLVGWAYYQEKMRLERGRWKGEAKAEAERYRLMLGVGKGPQVPNEQPSNTVPSNIVHAPSPIFRHMAETAVSEWQKSAAAGQKVG